MRILLVQLFSNGDCLYATAIARQIKQDFPGCYLLWAIVPFCKDIIAGNPYVDEVIVVDSVDKTKVSSFRRYKKMVLEQEKKGVYDKVFITTNLDTNQAYYDGSIRSCILQAYQRPIKVPVTPVLKLTAAEMERVAQFAITHQLSRYKNVVLFEFAPQSGQLKITREFAIAVAESLVQSKDTAVILSSALEINHPDAAIIDGSKLSIRETASLTNYCTLLLGCSSGISWISTSDAAKQLPMIQLLNADTPWINPVSRDFKRFGLPVETVIDMVEFDLPLVIACVQAAITDFKEARMRFNQPIPLQFKTTTNIVYNLLCYLQFSSIVRHIRVNQKIYPGNGAFYWAVAKGFFIFPFRLVYNLLTK
jgi:hypothetical protein